MAWVPIKTATTEPPYHSTVTAVPAFRDGSPRLQLEGNMHGRSAARDVDSVLLAAAGLGEAHLLDEAGIQLVAVVA